MVEEKRSDIDRIGCDLCKQDKATEKFIGMIGNILWFCRDCEDILIKGSNIIRKAQSKE